MTAVEPSHFASTRRALPLIQACASLLLMLACASPGWSEEEEWNIPISTQLSESEPLPAPEPTVGLTLAELEERALQANPSIRRLSALVGAARGTVVQAGLWPNPSIGYEGQQLGSGGRAEQHGVLFSQEIIRGGKLRLSRAVACSERMRIEEELAAQELRVLTDVRIAFYQVLLAERQIRCAEDLIRISNEGAKSVDTLFRANEVGRTDVLQAQLETENARLLAENSRNRFNAAWQSLAAVVGDPDLAPQPLIGDPTAAPSMELSFDEALARLLEESPELSAAAMEVDRARLALERERAEPTPNVTFEGLVNWQDNGIGGRPDGGVALSFPIPLFDRNQGAILRASQELIAARQALAQAELDLRNRLAPIYEQYKNAQNQVKRYREKILPAAEEALSLTRQVYAAGETNYTTLLTAQRTYSQTQLNYLDAVLALRIAEAEVEGLLLSGSLDSSPGATSAVGSSSLGQTAPMGGLETFHR